jgi:serine/arginine repetitive matrix protein 1
MASFRGTTAEQDPRFGGDKKLLLTMTKAGRFSAVLDQKVPDMRKVNLDVIRQWVEHKISTILGVEDDVIVELCMSWLELAQSGAASRSAVDPKSLQLQLTGFLEKATKNFVEELWRLLLDAQNNPGGIPTVFLEAKKEKLREPGQQEQREHTARRRSRWGPPHKDESLDEELGGGWGRSRSSSRHGKQSRRTERREDNNNGREERRSRSRSRTK